jgi:GNAT superfamily N-acetyltransferase
VPEIILRDIIRDGDKETIIARHRSLYKNEFGFNSDFGSYVEETLRENVERIWIAEYEGEFAGCIGLVRGEDRDAQLRWFLVEPRMRGKNIGRRLIQALIDYCKENGDKRIFLWTVDELLGARKIYEEFGFILTESKPKRLLWGKSITEQRWDLSLE